MGTVKWTKPPIWLPQKPFTHLSSETKNGELDLRLAIRRESDFCGCDVAISPSKMA